MHLLPLSLVAAATLLVGDLALAQSPADAPKEAVLGGDGIAPVVLLDGSEITPEQLAALEEAAIGEIRILSGEQAAEAYEGRYGESGAVVVTSAVDAAPELGAAEALVATGPAAEVTVSLPNGDDTYVLVDGQVSDLARVRAMPPSEIADIEVLDPSQAIERFGDVGAPGAVVVTTKSE